MSAAHPLAPLTASGPLRIAIAGPRHAGKTALLSHLLSPAHETLARPAFPQPASRPRNALLARLAASPVAFFVSRALRAAAAVGRLINAAAPSCTRHDFLPAPGAEPVTVWDAVGENGMLALADFADDIDVVLFVTRLDDTRAERTDRVRLVELLNVFGKDVLDRIVVVLTRGCALPPLDLTFQDFVRGRSDLITSYVRLVWPPVAILPVGYESTGEPQHGLPPLEEPPSEDAPPRPPTFVATAQTSTDWEDIGLFARKLTGRGRNDQPEDDADRSHPAVDAVMSALANDDNTDEGSVSAIPDDFLDHIFDATVPPDDKRVFTDPLTPPIAVVELSDACPVDEHHQKVLPDGVPWLPNLVATISKAAADAPRKAAERRARKEASVRPPPSNFSSRLREMLRSLSHDAFRMILVEVSLIVLVWQIGSAIEDARERRRKALEDDESDVLLAVSDEEYETLTRPDPGSGGNAVIGGKLNEEEELDLLESEEEFFGRRGAGIKPKRERIQTPFPQLPQLPFTLEKKPRPSTDRSVFEKKPTPDAHPENGAEKNGKEDRSDRPEASGSDKAPASGKEAEPSPQPENADTKEGVSSNEGAPPVNESQPKEEESAKQRDAPHGDTGPDVIPERESGVAERLDEGEPNSPSPSDEDLEMDDEEMNGNGD